MDRNQASNSTDEIHFENIIDGLKTAYLPFKFIFSDIFHFCGIRHGITTRRTNKRNFRKLRGYFVVATN